MAGIIVLEACRSVRLLQSSSFRVLWQASRHLNNARRSEAGPGV